MMFQSIRRFIFAGFLVLSLTLNAALVVSEFAYNIAYGLISNAVSIVYETAELTSSLGWKNSKLNKTLEEIDKKLLKSTTALKNQTDEILLLKSERSALRTRQQELSKEILLKQNEIDNLDATNQSQRRILNDKLDDIKELNRDLFHANKRLNVANQKLTDLDLKNSSLQSELDRAKNNLSTLRNDISGNKLQNKQLSEALTKQTKTVAKLTKSTGAQLLQIQQTKKIIRETTDRTSKRIAKRVARNIAAMPFESVPVAGIAITVGTIYLEIQDACQSLKEFDEMKAALGLNDNITETDQSYCALTKDDLMRLITNRASEFEACISQNDFKINSNVEDLMTCLPEQVEELSIPEFDKFEKPADAEL